LLQRKDRFRYDEIQEFLKRVLDLPYLKQDKNKLWVGEPETITAFVSVLEKKP
jgi:hypothetical protein